MRDRGAHDPRQFEIGKTGGGERKELKRDPRPGAGDDARQRVEQQRIEFHGGGRDRDAYRPICRAPRRLRHRPRRERHRRLGHRQHVFRKTLGRADKILRQNEIVDHRTHRGRGMAIGGALDRRQAQGGKRDHRGCHSDAEIEDQRRPVRRDVSGDRADGGEEVSRGKGDALVEIVGDQGTGRVGVNDADDVEARAQRPDGARVAAKHRMPRREALSDDDDRRAPSAVRRDRALGLDHAGFQAGAAHLFHQRPLDRMLPGGQGIAAVHVDFRQARERHGSEFHLREPLRNPFQQALAEFEGAPRKHVTRTDVVEERDRRRHAVGAPEAIEIDVDE